jgi:hypothetical protein
MNTYGKVNSEGYLEYTVCCSINQPHLILLGDIPPAPKPGLFFHVQRNQWEDLLLPEENTKIQEDCIRKIRLELLQSTDWTDTSSAPLRLGEKIYNQWQTYRQQLRDITSQSGYPFNVVWPTPPQG